MSRKGRGHLSSIELLPDEAQPDIQWARIELKNRDRLLKDIHAEFNARLADRGLGPISSSAFGRHSVRLAAMARRHEEVGQIAKVLIDKKAPEDINDLTMAISATIKTLIYEMLEDGDSDSFNPKQAKEMAEAMRALASTQKLSSDQLRASEKELAVKVEETVEKVAQIKGFTKETVNSIKAKILNQDAA